MSTEQMVTIATAELGHSFRLADLKEQCRVVIGGVAWPNRKPGVGLVLAVTGGRAGWPHEFHVLDEVEAGTLPDLIRKCDALDSRYLPMWWMGDRRKKAAEAFMRELHEARQPKGADEDEVRTLYSVFRDASVDDEGFYEEAIPRLKALLSEENRQLFLKTSHVRNDLGQIKEEEIPAMQYGDFPAIEALWFAVKNAQWWIDTQKDRRRFGRRGGRPSAWTC